MSFVTKQRLFLGLALLLMLTPTFLYGAGMLGRAPLFEGDVRKEMTCLTCDGIGRLADEESCRTCRGRGVADFIIPGPNRPQQLVGTIIGVDGKVVEGADVALRQAEGDQTELLLHSNGDGQFGMKLPPGDYAISIKTEDNGHLERPLTIEFRADPVPAVGPESLYRLDVEFQLER